MCGETSRFTEAVFSRLPAMAQHYRGTATRDKMGKGLSWATLGSFIKVQHDPESCPVSVEGRRLGGEWRGRLVGAARR